MSLISRLRSNGREPARETLVLRGLLALVTLTAIVTVLVMYGRGAFADELRAVVRLDTAGGSLVSNSDVKYDGVIVGKVRAIRSAPGDDGKQVEVDLALPREVADAMPGNVEARVLPASVFGTSFVDLVTRGEAQGELSEGQVIAQDTSTETLEIQRILDNVDGLIKALGPAELAGALNSLSSALQGNGDRIGRTIERLGGYLGKLSPHMDLVRENLTLLATNLEAFERYAPDLFDATEHALVAARTIADSEEEFQALTRQGSRTLDDTSDLLDANEEALVETLLQTANAVDVLFDGRTNLRDGLLATIDLAAGFRAATAEGRYAKIDGNLVRDLGAPYGPADCPSYQGLRGRGC